MVSNSVLGESVSELAGALRKGLCLLLVGALVAVAVPGRLAQASATASVRAALSAELVRLGVAPAEADARLAALSDAEVTDLAVRLENAPAGQGGGVAAVFLGVCLVFITLVITDTLGVTDVFPWVKKAN